MPFYLEDVDISALTAVERSVLREIAGEIGESVVNPSMALSLIHRFLTPLLAAGQHELLRVVGQPSWDRIHTLYPQLAFASNKGQDRQLIAAATLVHLLFLHTTRPPRDVQFPPFVELSSFRRIAGYLKLPVVSPSLLVGEHQLDLYKFCQYCWLPARARDLCALHSIKPGNLGRFGKQSACGHTTQKQGNRLKELFDMCTLAFVSQEELDFHESDFALPVMFPPSGLAAWLCERRPFLGAEFTQRHTSGANPLDTLLSILYGSQGNLVAESIGGAVHLLTPITARAEGWMTAWNVRPSHGGNRRKLSI